MLADRQDVAGPPKAKPPAAKPPKKAAAPVITPPPPPRPPSGGGGGGMGSGRSVGSNSSGVVTNIAPPPAPPPAPKPPSIDQFLAGDTTYKQQQDAAKKALADYLAQMTGQKGQYETQYGANLHNLQDSRRDATTNLNDDYASRGLSTSGLYVKALQDLNTGFDKQNSDLASGESNFLANLAAGLTNFKADQEINNIKYRNDALARRQASLG